MKLHIEKNTLLIDVQRIFSETFSHLSLQFFIDKNHDGNFSPDEKILNNQLSFTGLCNKDLNVHLVVEPHMTPKQLEEMFYEKVGIVTQVFRKRGEQWLMTTSSDHQTLVSLNEQSIELDSPIRDDERIDAADRMELE